MILNVKIQHAIKILIQGGIVIFPTDTAYGIGCRIDDEKSVKRLFKIRKRAVNKAVPVLVASVDMAQEYLKPISQDVKNLLIKPYWPGALTIVVECIQSKVPKLVRGGENTIGVRVPDHEITMSLIRNLGVPIIGTSANFSGESTPFSFDMLDKELVKLVDYVIEGECNRKSASTVIDVTGKPWKILRQGALNLNY